MLILFIIVGIVIVLYFVSKGSEHGVLDKIETFGPPSIFLSDILDTLKADFSEYRVITENKGRYKIKFQSKSFSLQLDFIYFKNHIQVCLNLDTMLKRNTIKTFNCPYSPKIIEKEIMDKFKDAFGMPKDIQ